MNIIPKLSEFYYIGKGYMPENADIVRINDDRFAREEYDIEISTKQITVKSATDEGYYRAMTTLRMLMDYNKEIRVCHIHDKPRFSYRAFMIDSARHMQSIEEIKKMINAAAQFKFNVFHWHLCDDQGYRIESTSLPELNIIGSYRKNDRFGKIRSDLRYGGYYTKDEIRDIVAYAKERYIEVVPEIDMPGHTTAIISTFPNVSCEGKKIDVRCTGGIFPEILCAGNDETFELIYKILDEVIELFPGDYVHIGGDEAPKIKWKNCEKCQKRMKDHQLKNEEELQGWFMNKVADYLSSKGKKTISWNESLKSGILSSDIIVQQWLKGEKAVTKHVNNGGSAIFSDFGHVYLDYPHSFTPLDKVYSYKPVFKIIHSEENILGIDSPLWTEFITDDNRLEYLAYPRLCAVSEIAWSDEKSRNYDDFLKRLDAVMPIFEKLNINVAPKSDWHRTPEGVRKTIQFFINITRH
jgi:hexosaminidase